MHSAQADSDHLPFLPDVGGPNRLMLPLLGEQKCFGSLECASPVSASTIICYAKIYEKYTKLVGHSEGDSHMILQSSLSKNVFIYKCDPFAEDTRAH